MKLNFHLKLSIGIIVVFGLLILSFAFFPLARLKYYEWLLYSSGEKESIDIIPKILNLGEDGKMVVRKYFQRQDSGWGKPVNDMVMQLKPNIITFDKLSESDWDDSEQYGHCKSMELKLMNIDNKPVHIDHISLLPDTNAEFVGLGLTDICLDNILLNPGKFIKMKLLCGVSRDEVDSLKIILLQNDDTELSDLIWMDIPLLELLLEYQCSKNICDKKNNLNINDLSYAFWIYYIKIRSEQVKSNPVTINFKLQQNESNMNNK